MISSYTNVMLRKKLEERSVYVDGPLATQCKIYTGSVNGGGYGQISVEGVNWLAHRAAYYLAHGPMLAPGLVCCHRCDRPACTEISHLFLGSQQANSDDKHAKGRAVHVRDSAAKLTPNDVLMIREMHSQGLIRAEIARHFGVSWNAIGNIVNGSAWAWLTSPPPPAPPLPTINRRGL
jgi:hypothetical protein